MHEAADPVIDHYSTMNTFFTRSLAADARPIDNTRNVITCPADGAISEIGKISQNKIFQAKKHYYSLTKLMGGLEDRAAVFSQGSYATIYLSPKDYHRVHMPFAGTLKEMIHVPGRLFSVAPEYVNNIPGIFAKNERVISIFDTEIGTMALILVGAMFVSSIETVWSGVVVPPRARRVTQVAYAHNADQINLIKGEEMGRFNMGSTVIMLFANPSVTWDSHMIKEHSTTLGQRIGAAT